MPEARSLCSDRNFWQKKAAFYIKNISALFCMITNFRRRCCVEKVKCREKCWKICWKWIEYRNEISLSDIADAAKVSKREALRCFQEEIHISPGAYLKDYRLQMACTMLRNTSETITTVSQNCGFHSASYFGKVFRSQMGCTPYEFKNKTGTGNREGISEKN